MKSVLISIQPKWCELIASGKKTIEVRKSAPKEKEPFKVYIYQTKKKWIYRLLKKLGLYQGKIIGEFVCDYILSRCESVNADIAEQRGCIKREILFEYSNSKPLYGWHISDLKIYDKPKELGEFSRFGFERMGYSDCVCANEACKYREKQNSYYDPPICMYGNGKQMNCRLTRPSQSWCYVEEL